MKLYLVHHGDAVAKEIDSDRPLSETGRQDLARLAGVLAKARVRVARVIHSGKTRARQTAEILAPVVAPAVGLEILEGLHPDDPIQPFLTQLPDCDTLIAGHGPFFSRLIPCLVAGQENATWLATRPGTLFVLEQAAEGGWHLAGMVRPELCQF